MRGDELNPEINQITRVPEMEMGGLADRTVVTPNSLLSAYHHHPLPISIALPSR